MKIQKKITKKKNRESESSLPCYKVVILGKNEIGKTQLLHRFNSENFVKEYYPTFGVDYRIKEIIDEKTKKHTCDIQMIEIAGEKDKIHLDIEKDIINTTHAFICVFTLEDETSVFDAVNLKKEYQEKIGEFTDRSKRKWFLIGTKKDLGSAEKTLPPQFKEKFDNYYEVSSKEIRQEEFDKIISGISHKLNKTMKDYKFVNIDEDKENEPFEIDFEQAHKDLFDEECHIF